MRIDRRSRLKKCARSYPLTLTFLLFSLFAAGVTADDFDCRKKLASLVFHLQRGSVGLTSDPLGDFQQAVSRQSGKHTKTNDKENPNSLFAFESDILDLFAIAPELRDLHSFRKKWHLTSEQAFDVLSYYGTRVFHEEPLVVGTPEEVFRRFSDVSRFHYLGSPGQDPAALRYRYYLANVTRKSVPEIAKQLGLTEGQVYNELSQLQISILQEFSRQQSPPEHRGSHQYLMSRGLGGMRPLLDPKLSILEQARVFYDRGLSLDETAATLGIGRSALEFIFHHVGIINRGVVWDRILPFEGKRELENVILATLFNRGYSHSEIADQLNRIAGTTDLSEPEHRTASAVGHQLRDLELRRYPDRTNISEVYDPRYGYLKLGGSLVPNAAIRFLIDHGTKTEEWLANSLGVQVASLQKFMKRHHILRAGTDRLQRAEPKQDTSELLSKYQRQREAVDKYLDWVQTNGRAPTRRDFGLKAGEVGVSGTAFFGTAEPHVNFFPNKDSAMLAVKRRARERGIEFSLIDEFYRSPLSEGLRKEMQVEASDRFLRNWAATNPRSSPSQPHWGKGDGKIGLRREAFFGVGDYGPAGKNRGYHIFENQEEAMLFLKQRAPVLGIDFQLLDQKFYEHPSERIRNIWKEEAADRYLDIYLKAGRHPELNEFGLESDIGIPYSRVFGLESYRPGKDNGHNRVFDSPSQALVYIKQRAIKRGIPLSLLELSKRKIPPSRALRKVWQSEATTLYLDYYRLHGHPGEENWGPKNPDITTPKVGVRISQMFASGEYRRGGGTHRNRWHLRIFDSPASALLQFKRQATANGEEFWLIDYPILKSKNITAEVKQVWREEATSRIVSWMKLNGGQSPKRENFGKGPGQIRLNWNPVFGTGQHSPEGSYAFRAVFGSPEEATKALNAVLRPLGMNFEYSEN